MKGINVLFFAFLTFQITFAQDVVLSDYRLYQMQLNPALAGNDNGVRISTFFQNQKLFGSSFTNAFGISIDSPVKLRKSLTLGLGYQFYRDMTGETKFGAKNHQLSAALTKNIGKQNLTHAFSLGILFGFNNQSFDNDNFRWPSQIGPNGFDPNLPSGVSVTDLSIIYFGLNLGANYSLKSNKNHQLDVGFAINNINRPIVSFLGTENKLYTRKIYYLRPTIMIKEKVGVVGSFFYTEQGVHNTYNFSSGVLITKNDKFINVNFGYQKNDMPFVSIFLGYKKIKIGSNYNFATNKLAANKIEGFISYTFVKKGESKN